MFERSSFHLGSDTKLEVKDFKRDRVEIILSKPVFVENELIIQEFFLTLRQWQELMRHQRGIQEAVMKVKEGIHVHYEHRIGHRRYVEVKNGFQGVSIYAMWLPEGQCERIRIEFTVKAEVFDTLVKLQPEIEDTIPELDRVQICLIDTAPRNPEGCMKCTECEPNEFKHWWTCY